MLTFKDEKPALPTFVNLNKSTREEIKKLGNSGLEHAAVLQCEDSADLEFFLRSAPRLKSLYLYCRDLQGPLHHAFCNVMPQLVELTIAVPVKDHADLESIAKCTPFVEVLRVTGDLCDILDIVHEHLPSLRALRYLPNKDQSVANPSRLDFSSLFKKTFPCVEELFLDIPLDDSLIEIVERAFPSLNKGRFRFKVKRNTSF